jgi:lia operon protein LiaG
MVTKLLLFKTMKTKMIFTGSIFALLMAGSISAQEYKVTVDNAKSGKLSLNNFSGDLKIEAYTGNEILFSPAGGEEMTVPERAKGLKPVYGGGVDNTGVGLSVEKNGSNVSVTCLLPFTNSHEYTIKVPENMSIEVKSECQNNNDIYINGMKNEIEIQSCQSIKLKGVSGPLVLSTISGDIEVTFDNIATGKPFSINSISGEIDITLPAKIAADIEMNSVSGRMYSDFDFSDKSKDMNQIGGNELNTKLNGGGAKFSIVTVSGNIYLRKGA